MSSELLAPQSPLWLLDLGKAELHDDDVEAACEKKIEAYRRRVASTTTRKSVRLEFQEIDVSHNFLAWRGCAAIVNAALQCQDLRVVKLFRNELTDRAASCVARLAEDCPALEQLHLSYNQFTAVGAKEIITAANRGRGARRDRNERAVITLWLRLEHNRIRGASKVLEELWEKRVDFCEARDSQKCGPRICKRSALVHLPYFAKQDLRDDAAEDDDEVEIIMPGSSPSVGAAAAGAVSQLPLPSQTKPLPRPVEQQQQVAKATKAPEIVATATSSSSVFAAAAKSAPRRERGASKTAASPEMVLSPSSPAAPAAPRIAVEAAGESLGATAGAALGTAGVGAEAGAVVTAAVGVPPAASMQLAGLGGKASAPPPKAAAVVVSPHVANDMGDRVMVGEGSAPMGAGAAGGDQLQKQQQQQDRKKEKKAKKGEKGEKKEKHKAKRKHAKAEGREGSSGSAGKRRRRDEDLSGPAAIGDPSAPAGAPAAEALSASPVGAAVQVASVPVPVPVAAPLAASVATAPPQEAAVAAPVASPPAVAAAAAPPLEEPKSKVANVLAMKPVQVTRRSALQRTSPLPARGAAASSASSAAPLVKNAVAAALQEAFEDGTGSVGSADRKRKEPPQGQQQPLTPTQPQPQAPPATSPVTQTPQQPPESNGGDAVQQGGGAAPEKKGSAISGLPGLGNIAEIQKRLAEEKRKLSLFVIKAKQDWEERRVVGQTNEQEYYIASNGEVLGPNGEFSVEDSIGKGVFSSVFRCRDNRLGGTQFYALKFVRANHMMRRAAEKEVEMYRRLKKHGEREDHEGAHFLMGLDSIETFVHQGHLCMVFELLKCDLRTALSKYGQGRGLPLQTVAQYSRQIFLGLRCLRKCRIIHGDLKPDNVLMSLNKTEVKICDFGSAMDISEEVNSPYLQPRYYRAPEIIIGLPFDTQIDLWSAGVTLFELSTGKILFAGKTNNIMVHQMLEVCGDLSKRLATSGSCAPKHFTPAGDFLLKDPESITGEPEVLSMRRFATPKRPIGPLIERILKEPPPNADTKTQERLCPRLADLVSKCLRLDPGERFTPDFALDHPFFKKDK